MARFPASGPIGNYWKLLGSKVEKEEVRSLWVFAYEDIETPAPSCLSVDFQTAIQYTTLLHSKLATVVPKTVTPIDHELNILNQIYFSSSQLFYSFVIDAED